MGAFLCLTPTSISASECLPVEEEKHVNEKCSWGTNYSLLRNTSRIEVLSRENPGILISAKLKKLIQGLGTQLMTLPAYSPILPRRPRISASLALLKFQKHKPHDFRSYICNLAVYFPASSLPCLGPGTSVKAGISVPNNSAHLRCITRHSNGMTAPYYSEKREKKKRTHETV